MEKLLEQYIAQNPASSQVNTITEHICHVRLSDDSRFASCKMTLNVHDSGKMLHVSVELPIHVNRSEAKGVSEGLSRINAYLDKYEAFTLKVIEGIIAYELFVDAPSSAEAIQSIIDSIAFETIGAYSNLIMHLVADEANTVERKEKERIEAEQADKNRKTNSIFDRFLSYIGLLDNNKTLNDEDEME